MAEPTMVSLLLDPANAAPDGLAFGYLVDGERELATLTYAELVADACRVGSVVGDRVAPGGRAVLVYEPGLDFVSALFGCFLAGVVAVPVYPPMPPNIDAGIAAIDRVVADCGAELVLSTSLMHALTGRTDWVATDDRAVGDADGWVPASVRGSDIAMLQYTSGSTGDPKGVVLRHDGLRRHIAIIRDAMGLADHSHGVSWLPLYHDMGLIGFVFVPLTVGRPNYFLSPLHFLERPGRWMRAISDLGATISGAPNFAYELCLRRVGDDELDGVDLSRWKLAFTGAEPVSDATLRRFVERYGPHGFDERALFPCYGMAEATLMVTGKTPPTSAYATLTLDPAALADGVAVEVEPGAEGKTVVSCGPAGAGMEVEVVDPDAGKVLPLGTVGELWVRSESGAEGYWGRPELTEATFGARLEGKEGRYLRTGDLGFQHDLGVFVTGRLKDMIIVRGRNVYAQDVEDAAQELDERLRKGCGAAFAADDDEERVVLVQEVGRADAEELAALADLVQRGVQRRFGIRLTVALVAPRSVPKTTSGKLRRSACRAAFAGGELEVLAATDREPV